MFMVDEKSFQGLINEAMASLPSNIMSNLKNVAILYSDEPSTEQRKRLDLQQGQTLLGLYEGVPLSERQGQSTLLPDRITLFRNPISVRAANFAEMKELIRHALWHEIAHYYGLGHERIRKLEGKGSE